jgi:hypothetical protein
LKTKGFIFVPELPAAPKQPVSSGCARSAERKTLVPGRSEQGDLSPITGSFFHVNKESFAPEQAVLRLCLIFKAID